MLRKRVWIPLLSCMLCVIAGYFLYVQLPRYAAHKMNFVAQRVPEGCDDALQWFQRHQSNDGRWSANYHQFYCDDRDEYTESPYRSDVAYTSLAMLIYFSCGYDHKTPSKYEENCQTGLQWLLQQQNLKGSFSPDNYQQALAAIVICEAYAMTMDPALKEPAQKAVNVVIDRIVAVDSHRYGWSARQGAEEQKHIIDFVMTMWSMMAIKSAKSGGLETHDTTSFLRTAYAHWWLDQNEGVHTHDINFAQSYNILEDQYSDSATAAAWAEIIVGYRPGNKELDTLMPSIMKYFEKPFAEMDPWTMYVSALSTFQYGGEVWTPFVRRRKELKSLFSAENNCQNGSMRPHMLASMNRFESTVFACLSMMTWYRYERITGKPMK